MTDESSVIELPPTPIRYSFVSVHRIVGFSAPIGGSDLTLALQTPGASARITVDPNTALKVIDRGDAIAQLMLRAFVGETPSGSPLEAAEQRAVQFANDRLKRFGAGGYVVVEVLGETLTTATSVARDLGDAVLAFDAVDKAALQAKYHHLVDSVLAGVTLVTKSSLEIQRVTEGVAMSLPDERPLYSVTIRGGSARLSIARSPTVEDARAIEEMVARLLKDERLSTPARLLVDALRRIDDRLEAFIFAWAALEMLVRKFTPNCESGNWVDTAPDANRDAAVQLHRTFVTAGHQFYSLIDRLRAFALMRSIAGVDALVANVQGIRKHIREPLIHEGKLAEQSLPVETLTEVVRDLLAVAVPKAVG